MDSQQEVSSTMAEDSEVFIEIEVSQSQNNGISLAEAANALITLQVPSKDPSSLTTISSTKTGDSESSKLVLATEGNPKDVRKKILEGMKSQFNTSAEEEVVFEQSNRRGPHRSKSKFKLQKFENEEDVTETPIKSETPKNSRGRGRPPRVPQIEKNQQTTTDTTKTDAESNRIELDSSSEAGSERSDSATGGTNIITTRRSQRTNISRTSATDLLKGQKGPSETRPIKNWSSESELVKPPSESKLVKPIDHPRKRGRPSKGAVLVEANKIEKNAVEAIEEAAVEDVSKVEHMASLGLQSKSSPDAVVHQSEIVPCRNLLDVESGPANKKLRIDGSSTKDISPPETEPFHTSSSMDDSLSSDNLVLDTSGQTSVNNGSLTDESALVANSLENEVELSIVEEQVKPVTNGHTPLQINGTISLLVEKTTNYACSCVESHPPVAIVPPAAPLYCQAVDSVGGKLVGCCLVANRKRFYRPSKKISFMILCDSHRDRIRKHFCCPGCGLFCTQASKLCRKITQPITNQNSFPQGTFLQCRALEGSIHFFHADCQHPGQKKTCLHCQRDSAVTEIRLQMKTCAVPVFCNDAKLLKTM